MGLGSKHRDLMSFSKGSWLFIVNELAPGSIGTVEIFIELFALFGLVLTWQVDFGLKLHNAMRK